MFREYTHRCTPAEKKTYVTNVADLCSLRCFDDNDWNRRFFYSDFEDLTLPVRLFVRQYVRLANVNLSSEGMIIFAIRQPP